VGFIAQLTVSRSPNYVMADARSAARFAVSYDIWGERFSVTQVMDRPEQKRTVSHLTGPNAEAWCLEKLAISRAELPADKPFYVQLELRVLDQKDPRDQSGVIGDAGISISRMLEIFSQPVREKETRWLLNAGPIRVEDLLKGMHG